MPSPTPLPANFSDTLPVASTGKKLAKWQAGAPYNFTVSINGVDTVISIRDVSAQMPNIGGVDARTTVTETVALASQGKLVTFSNAAPVAVALTTSVFAAGDLLFVANIGVGTATITPSTGTIDGGATLPLTTNQGCTLFFDGTNWKIVRGISATAGGDVTGPGVAVASDFVQFDGTTGKLVKDGGLSRTTDGTLAANSDLLIPSEKAVKTYVDAAAFPGGISNFFAFGGDGSDGAATFDGTTTVDGIAPQGASVTLSAAAVGTGVNVGFAVYTTSAGIGGANGGLIGNTFIITGFVNGGNNATCLCVDSTNTTIVVVNAGVVAETHAGTATSGGQYRLTRDIFHTDLTVSAGVILKTSNYRIFGTGTLTVNGTITNSGCPGLNGQNGGVGAAPGLGGSVGTWTTSPTATQGSMGASIPGTFTNGNPTPGDGGNGGTGAGTQGQTGGAGISGTASAIVRGGVTGSTGAVGGKGGDGTSGSGGIASTGGGGRTVTVAAAEGRAPNIWFPVFLDLTVTRTYTMKNGAHGGCGGGSGGSGDATQFGGAGGGGGGTGGYAGYLFVAFQTIVVGAAGKIISDGGDAGKGGNGGTNSVGNVGGGGGGGGGTGGGGGVVMIIVHTYTNSGTVSANGGAAGNPGTKGAPHGTGTNNAADGAAGVAGQAGVVIQITC